jgi:hypothetical protein
MQAMRRLLSFVLLATIGISIVGCADSSTVNAVLGDAAFRFIDLVLNYDNIFQAAPDTILLAKDAFQLIETIPQNQSPPTDVKSGYTEVSILYLKKGVYAQDVYDVKTGKSSLGILFEGGKTFESISQNRVDIDATQTHQIWIVPLQNATSKVTISASKGWQNTGIFLVRGKQYQIKYLSGVWTISKGKVGTSDAAGQPLNAPPNLICHCGEPLPGYSTQAMVGRIGAGLGNAPLEVGDDFAGVAYDNDFLYLRMNLADPLLSYASGTITVTVQTNNATA